MEKNTTNALLKGIKEKVDALCEKKSYPPILLNYLYLITYGMISVYGTDYCDLIYATIEENEILLGFDAFKKRNSKEEIETATKFINNSKEAFVLQKVTKNENTYQIHNQICILHDFEKEPEISPIFILEFIAHELNRILTSKNRNFFYLNGQLACRCGLFRYVLSQDDDTYTSGKIVSEVVNTLQTEDIIKEILALDYHEIEIPGIIPILKSFFYLSFITYTSTGYKNETALFRELYSIPNYKEFINANILEGNIDAIIKDFEATNGVNSYEEFSSLYDTYSEAITTGKENNWSKKDIEVAARTAVEVKKFISSYREKKYPCMKWS